MPDRHAELLRQRALVQEHLAWLEREISAAAPSPTATRPVPLPPTTDLPAPPPQSPLPPQAVSGAEPGARPAIDPDSLLDQYRISPNSLHNDVRKGCLLYFAAALVLLGLGVLALYFMIS